MKDSDLDNMRFGDWPAPEVYLTEIGRISVLWSTLEQLVNLMLAKLSGFAIDDPKHFILFNHASFPQKLDMLSALSALYVDEHDNLKLLPEAVAKLKKAQKGRNKFMHNGLVLDPGTQQWVMPHGTARGKLKTQVEPIKVLDLKRVVLEIDDANKTLYKAVLNVDLPRKS